MHNIDIHGKLKGKKVLLVYRAEGKLWWRWIRAVIIRVKEFIPIIKDPQKVFQLRIKLAF